MPELTECTVHEVKSPTPEFEAIFHHRQLVLLRNDRPFRTRDVVLLREFKPSEFNSPTGRWVQAKITDKIGPSQSPAWLQPGVVALSLLMLKRGVRHPTASFADLLDYQGGPLPDASDPPPEAEELGSNFWMIWNANGKSPTVKHMTRAEADKEAERLARANPGQTFIVLRAEVGITTDLAPIVRHTPGDILAGEIPF